MRKHGNIALFGTLAILIVGILFIGLKSGSDSKPSGPTFGNGSRQYAPVIGLPEIADRLEKATKEERPALLTEGERIAKARLAELAQLAKTQPARALKAMMSLDELAALPPEIRALSEKPFSAVGSTDLAWSTSVNPDGSLKCSHRNLAIVDGETWEIAGESFLTPRQPMTNVPLNGYLVGETLVLQESGVRELSAAEVAVATDFFPDANENATDPVTGGAVDPAVAAVIGGMTYSFESTAIIEHVRETLANAEQATDFSKDREVAHGLAWLPLAANSGGSGGTVLATPFQDDAIDVLFIRADFPDLTGEAVTKATLESSLAAVNTRIQNFSYSKASINFTVSNNIYRLATSGQTVATTGGPFGDVDRIISEARAAAAGDFTLGDYDVVAVFFPNLSGYQGSKITFGGLATVGGANHWINGIPQQSQVEVILHEFGHNYGLNHANYFHPARLISGDYFDTAASSLEYGDIFDRMGEGNKDSGYFSPYATSRLQWMPPANVIQPLAGGTFRVHRFDSPSATSNTTLALKVPMGGNRFHWVGMRQLYPATAGKAYIVNEGIYKDTPNLIDATPGSAAAGIPDRADAALPVGSNFYDATSGVRFTTMASGGTEPNQYIDVKIDFDPRLELQSTNILVDEAAGNAVLVVKRGFNSLGACSVSYTTTGVTATSGTDFHATSGTLTWADGDLTSRTIFVPIRPDNSAEGTETFTFTLSAPANAVIPPASNVATITILDAGSRVAEFAPPFFNTSVSAILPLPDGKVMAGGTITSGVTGNIARFNSDGSEDGTFQKGTGLSGNGASTKVLSFVRQSDGKILVGGEFSFYNGTACSMITRLNPNGTPDTDFCTALGTGANNRINTIGLQADGKILLGGDFTMFNGTTANGLVRLTSTGARDLAAPFDPSFAFPGSVPVLIDDILVQDDGKVMIGGQFTLAPDGFGRFRFGIARLNSTGSRDDTFDPGYGSHFYDANLEIPSGNNSVRHVRSIARQRDGKYLIGGNFSGYDNLPANFLIRINSNGSRDNSFIPPTIVASPRSYPIEDIYIQPSGHILAVGRFASPAGRILALLENGSVFSAFSLSGGASEVSGGNGDVVAMASDSRGDIYMGGNFFNFAGTSSRPIVKIAGGVDSYSIWTNSVFTSVQIAAGNTGPEQDFDNDGILNITEMALGLSPTVPNSPNSFAIAAGNLSVQTSGGSQFLQASMQRSADNLGVWLVAQFSSDLTNWLPALPTPGSNATYDVTESSSTRFTVKDKTPSGPGVKRFVRFRAVVPN